MTFTADIDFISISNSDSGVQTFDAGALLRESQLSSYELFRQAVDDIKAIRREYITVVACSFGKDSTIVLLANLAAHMELMKEGVLDNTSPMVVSHINTLVESHLMQMLCNLEIKRLRAFCKEQGINLDLRIGTPPLAKQWSSLFLSGLKIISSARTNNDCSIIMKIDSAAHIEKAIESDYKGKTVTLLGSRLDESIARGAKMRRAGTDKVNAQDLISGENPDDRVFAPIMNMNDEDVWTLIRGAGDKSISFMPFTIESWAVNHRLLNIIYADSKDGSCAYSAKKIKGDRAQAGGCSGSARSGCYVCSKMITDKSGEEQVKKPRHAAISANILKVRNYIMWVAQDIQYRTFHSRAVDHTTGAVALQPNVLRAEVLDKLIWLLTQVTFDDKNRAERFKKLVEQGREMEDVGYADIMTDTSLDEEDRKALAKAYLLEAQNPLVTPMSFDIAVYLSAIHARDGIRLPPHRAVWIWNEVANGARIPYPDVDPTMAVVSDIPDAIMAIPSAHIPYPSIHEFDFLSMDDAEGCEVDLKQFTTKMPVHDAKHFLVDDNGHHLDGKKDADTIELNGITELKWASKIRMTGLSKAIPKQFSKRAIKRVSRKGGGFTVVERGRTSVNSPSFSKRDAMPHLARTHTTNIPLYVNDKGLTESLNLADDDGVITGFDINLESFYDWIQFGGLESALDTHNSAVEMRERHEDTIYLYGGMGAFQHYARYGMFKLNEKALVSTKRILQRTAYFNRIGMLMLDEDAIIDISTRQGEDQTIELNEYRNFQARNLSIDIDTILSMPDYRAYKAEKLLSVRSARNEKRRELKALISDFTASPLNAAINQIEYMSHKALPYYKIAYENAVIAKTMIDNGISGFDTSDYRQELKINMGIIRHIKSTLSENDAIKRLFDPAIYKAINEKGDAFKLGLAGDKALALFAGIEGEIENHVLARARGEFQMVRKEDMLMTRHNITFLSKLETTKKQNVVKRNFSLNGVINMASINF